MNKLLKFINEVVKIFKSYKVPPKEVIKEEKPQEEVNIPIEVETPIEEPETKPSETYKMLSIKEYQIYLKKLGLYTKNIDGVVGSGTEKAIYQFNTIFFNNKSDVYTEKIDRLLRIIYNAYCKSVYMTDDLWQYFKNFKKTEYKCKCKGQYCLGYPHEISIHIVMADQYARNIYNKSVSITSGLRCKDWNKKQGGTANSVHPKGQASDSGIEGVKASTLRATYKELPFVYYSYDITSKYVHKSVRL